MGYQTEEGLFSAAEVGASHQRQRFFILAHCESAGAGNDTRGLRGWARRVGANVADADSARSQGRDIGGHSGGERAARTSSAPVGDAEDQGRAERRERFGGESPQSRSDMAIPLFAPFRNDYDGWARLLPEMPTLEPAFCKYAHESPNRVDQLRLLGNGVVPATAALAFHTLVGRTRLK
ncbi:hypothetical protein CMI37_29715 [Candidatus Pacearchaeota archaeon]|nr:hypothetical protein [Candidatus Pacearchaeota archaeon]